MALYKALTKIRTNNIEAGESETAPSADNLLLSPTDKQNDSERTSVPSSTTASGAEEKSSSDDATSELPPKPSKSILTNGGESKTANPENYNLKNDDPEKQADPSKRSLDEVSNSETAIEAEPSTSAGAEKTDSSTDKSGSKESDNQASQPRASSSSPSSSTSESQPSSSNMAPLSNSPSSSSTSSSPPLFASSSPSTSPTSSSPSPKSTLAPEQPAPTTRPPTFMQVHFDSSLRRDTSLTAAAVPVRTSSASSSSSVPTSVLVSVPRKENRTPTPTTTTTTKSMTPHNPTTSFSTIKIKSYPSSTPPGSSQSSVSRTYEVVRAPPPPPSSASSQPPPRHYEGQQASRSYESRPPGSQSSNSTGQVPPSGPRASAEMRPPHSQTFRGPQPSQQQQHHSQNHQHHANHQHHQQAHQMQTSPQHKQHPQHSHQQHPQQSSGPHQHQHQQRQHSPHPYPQQQQPQQQYKHHHQHSSPQQQQYPSGPMLSPVSPKNQHQQPSGPPPSGHQQQHQQQSQQHQQHHQQQQHHMQVRTAAARKQTPDIGQEFNGGRYDTSLTSSVMSAHDSINNSSSGGIGGGLMMPPSLLPPIATTSNSSNNTTDSNTYSSSSNSNGGGGGSANRMDTSSPHTTNSRSNGNTFDNDDEVSSPQFYCLRWNNYVTNFANALMSLRNSLHNADATIFCQGTILRVHKIILQVSSTHFQRILHDMPEHQHPFIVLDGIDLSDIQTLIEYMYKGEVNVAQHKLSSLLKTAETLGIKGLTDIDQNAHQRDRFDRNGCRDPPSDHSQNRDRDPPTDHGQNRNRDHPSDHHGLSRDRDHSSADHHGQTRDREPPYNGPTSSGHKSSYNSSMSPPSKRSRMSPDKNMHREHPSLRDDGADHPHHQQQSNPRDLRVEPRAEFSSRDSSRDQAKDLSRDSSRDRDPSRDHSGIRDALNRNISRDLSREVKREYRGGDLLQREQQISRDLARDIPRDLSSHGFPSMVGSSSTGWPSNTSPSPTARSMATTSSNYYRPPQYEGAHQPPRSSPNSLVPENKLPAQLGISPFLPFNLTNLPILQDSKKILERTSHLLLPNTRYEPDERDSREPERLVSSWTPRHGAAEGEPEKELGNGSSERNLDRERETTERYTILQKTLMQHKQNQQREREQRERELQQQQHSSILSFQLSQQQQQLSSLQQQQQAPQSSSSSEFPALPFSSSLASDAPDRHDHKDVKDVKSVRIIAEAAERSHDDDKNSISPPHDKNQYSPPSDADSGGSGKHESDGLVMDEEEEEEDSRSSAGRGDTATDLSKAVPHKLITKFIKGETNGNVERVKCPYCTKAYRHQNNLRTHIRCFHKGVRIPCPICQRGFTRWFTVRCHIAREHSNIDMSRPDQLPAQLRRALYSGGNQFPDAPPRPALVSPYQDDLRLTSTSSALSPYGEPGNPGSALSTQP